MSSSAAAIIPPQSTITITPVTGYTGAEITGVNLSAELDAPTYVEIQAALHEYGVIFFRDQHLTPEQYVAFAAQFGEVSVSKSLPTLPDHPMINQLVRNPDQTRVVGEVWHTDQAYRESPTFGTILYSREVPAYGGDTAFINMAQAYDELSEGLKKTLDGLRAVHLHSRNQINRDPIELAKRPESATHPVVTTHPHTGRKALFISPGYTDRFEGWTEAESAPLLNYLYQHAMKPEFGCRFRWENNSIAFWDNRLVWHYAVNDYYGVRRVMHRLVVG